jgi:hypothetical protein
MLDILLLASPAFAVSMSGSDLLDWSSLKMTGSDFTLSNLSQGMTDRVIGFNRTTDHSGDTRSTVYAENFVGTNGWGTRVSAVALASVGSATSSATELSGSLSLFSDRVEGVWAGGSRCSHYSPEHRALDRLHSVLSGKPHLHLR